MPTPLPTEADSLLVPPDADEVRFLGRGVISAIRPPEGLSPLQTVLMEAMFDALTGHPIDLGVEAIDPAAFAVGLARRNEAFRVRIVQVMILGALVLRPLPEEVAARVEAFARELSVADGMLGVVRDYAAGSFSLAAQDFDRNGYTAAWGDTAQATLHVSTGLEGPWATASDDAELAGRWRALEALPPGTLGRRVSELYRARGFAYPGTPGSAPPLLAQHDWVHVLADYGTTVESELEVFALIARASDDPRGFSLLAMVVSLFETGYLQAGAGLFEAFPGQLSRAGVATRVADAMRRGALVAGSVDFLGTDWFEVAHLDLDQARAHFGIVPKSAAARAAGSVSPWEPGGISPYQEQCGREAAAAAGLPYDSFGARASVP